MQEKIKEYRKKELEFENKHKRKPTCEEISNITGYDQSTIQLIEANLSDSISYDAQINTDEDNSFLDLIPDKNKTPDEIYLEKSQKQILFKAINEAGLTAREKDVIQRRFGFNGKIQTLESIGNIYGLSRERVRIIEKNALTKLQKYFKRYVWQEDNNNLYSRTIYSYFKDYQEIEVNYAISILPEEYKNIIYFKFGRDLKHHNRLLSMDKERKFYNEILPKITEILERLYPHNKIEPNNKVNSKTFKILLNLFKMYPFNELITEISYDRLLIGLLESGYVDGIKYTDEIVANFLGIDKANVCILNIEFKKRVYTNSLLSDIIENRDKYLEQAKESSTNNLTKRQ